MTNTIEIENLNISDLDIPTDETLQEVATACENIATSCDNVATACGDIAKDTTLQSTNTALGSLATDATLQATNTALGSLMADNTGQDIKDSLDDIKSAVQGLGTALGSDRALIDGSNIGDKATFRSNVGLCPKIKRKEITGTTDGQGRLLSTGWSIANLYIVGIIAGGNGQIALQLRLSNNNFAVKFLDSNGMSVIANSIVSCMVYYIEPD